MTIGSGSYVKSLLGLLLCIHICFAEEYVTLKSLTGQAEVRKAGQENWRLVGQGANLHNNDIFRVAKNSKACLTWSDESEIYLKENSQILINLHSNPGDNSVVQHFTVFFGAAFFLFKCALPKLVPDNHSKVYTPTAVIATRGTSYEVNVSKNNGTSSIKVLNGTVLVKNILKNSSLFLKAAYKTVVEINTDPIVPSAILEDDIALLKKWVPSEVIRREMKFQLSRAKRDHEIITGKLINKMVIVPLRNNSDYEGEWQLPKELAKCISAKLSESIKGLSANVTGNYKADPLSLGTDHEARFILRGSIEKFDISQHAKVSPSADEYREYNLAEIRLYLQLIDAETEKMVIDNYYSGEVSGKHDSHNSWETIRKYPCNLKDPHFSKSILGRALFQAIEGASQEITRYVKGE
ncbi:MAG: hypothetical protein GF401_06760 [Chitinivibrionales bacterium]|nr:hypothetical protein [Chitinivibrionales bacterium]